MALKVGDRVRENTSSTGVGGLSLAGAPAGFQRFSSVLASGDITYYTLEENDKFEVGIGTYGSNNLERTTVLSSSNSGNKISLGGSGTVFITYPAARAVFENQNTETVIGASGIVFSDNTLLKSSKLVSLSDVSLSGTPANSTVFDLNITNKALTIGDMTGPSNNENVLVGYGAGSGITTASYNVVVGSQAAVTNKTGIKNVYVGSRSGPTASDASIAVYSSVAVGYSAGNKMRHESVAVGYESAKNSYNTGFVGLGYQAGEGLGDYSNIIGYQAGKSLGENYAIALGYRAGYNGAGESAIWIGQEAGSASTGSTKSIGIGKSAGESSSGTECIYLGEGAGTSNSTNNLIFIGNATPSSNGTLIKGDMDNKRVAVGAADVTLSDTFFVGVGSANDEGVVVKAAVSQVSNLTSWKDSSSNVLASVSKNGTISAFDLHSTGNGIQISSITPASTSNRLYNVGGTLYFNGSQLASAGGASPTAQYASGLAITNEGRVNYASGQAIANESDIVAVSGIAAYASGVGGGGGDVTTAQLNYVSGVAAYSSGVLTGGTPTFDDVNVASQIFHDGDADTYIKFAGTDEIQFFAGGKNMLILDEATNDKVVINDDGLNINFRVESNNEANLLFTDGANDKVGIGTSSPSYLLDVAGMAQTTGAIVGNSGIVLANNTPSVTTNTLYNDGGTLKFNGSTIGGVDTYTSGVATYASGQAISNQSNITALNTASGIATSLLAVSGTATSLIASSGIAAYASGQAISNQSSIGTNTSNISTNTARVNYASGQAIANESDIAALLTASGTATSLIASSGIATYASGQAIANEGDLVAVSGIAAYASGVSLTVKEADGSPNVSNVRTIVVSNGTLTDNGAGQVTVTTGGGGGGGGTSAEATYASGQAISNQNNITALLSASGTATSLIASSGIAAYASGQAISNQSNITALNTASGIATSLLAVSGTATSLVASSGIATYASGQAIANESDIAALLTASGTATSLIASSGIATYASGNTANISFGSNAEGDILIHDGSKFTRLAKGTDNYILKMNGNLPNWEAESGGSSLTAGSGVVVDGANRINVYGGTGNLQEIQLTSDNIFTPKMIFTGSGVKDTPVTLKVLSSHGAVNTSGTALSFEGTQGQLFGITDNLSSGNIFSVADITGLPLISADASGDVKLGEYGRYVGVGTGIPLYGFDVSSSGQFQKGIILSSYVPATTTNTLYNDGGTLKFNGSAVGGGGGDVTTTQLNYVSGIAVYSSGQAISNQGNITALLSASGTATSLIASSGIATYASGQAISNQSNITALNTASGIATSLLAVSGTATSLVASSGIANYASGQAVSNQANIATNASNITYVSGVATNKFTVTASDSNNYTFNGMGLSNGLDPDLYLHKGHTYYFDKQTASHPFRVSATDGGSVYQDAAGNSIEISGQGVLKFEVPQNAPDKLYYYCTSHASNMKGEIYTTNNVDEIIHVSGIAAYASGQAISNQSNITALNTASGIATSLLSVSGTATSLVASSGVATYASGNTANISFGSNAEGDILIHDGSKFTRLAKGTDNYILKMNGNLPNWEAESSGGVSGDTFATDLKIGRDSQNLVDFASTDNKIILRANNINQISLIDNVFGPEADSDVDLGTTSVRWKDAYVDSITVTGNGDIDGDLDVDGTTNLDAVDIDGNVQIDGTVTVGVDDTGKDVKFYGATSGSYLEWDESEDRLNLVGAAYVQEAVPANDTPTAEDATVTLDLKKGNFHNISLGQNVTKFEFINAKRGQRFILRITQNGSSAKTVAWTNVDYTTGGAAATVRWAGNVVPTMSTSTSHTDVYGFLCTNNAGSNFDGFIIGQDLPD